MLTPPPPTQNVKCFFALSLAAFDWSALEKPYKKPANFKNYVQKYRI